jgi:hypothetical protein
MTLVAVRIVKEDWSVELVGDQPHMVSGVDQHEVVGMALYHHDHISQH